MESIKVISEPKEEISNVPRHLYRDASILTIGQKNKKIKINVGGEVHESFASTLQNIPDSPLAWILDENYKKALDYETENGELFFDRHPGIFAQIFDYFQTGKLHSPRNVCGPMFQEELRFWGIEEQQMECCCWHDYTRHRVTQENLKIFEPERGDCKSAEILDVERGQSQNSDEFQRFSKWRLTKSRMWLVLDQPSSSTASKLYAWISLAFIILSIVSFTVFTMDNVPKYNATGTATSNGPNNTTSSNMTNHNTTKNLSCTQSRESKLWFVVLPVESICVAWFTLELILRTICSPNKFEFLKNPFTILDVLAIAMSYVFLLIANKESDVIGILNMARFFRLSRFFKIIYSLQVLGRSLKASAYHFLILLVLLIIPVILFSSIIYYTEQSWGTVESKTQMASIPRAFWWAVVTMTTVGYGDAVPNSIPGFFVGGVAAVFGVIILSLTSSILGSTFQQYYNLAQTQRKIPKNRQNQVHVPLESLHEMAGLPAQDLSKSSINSGNSKSSGRDSGYGKSPVTKKKFLRSVSHPSECPKHQHKSPKRRSLKLNKINMNANP